MNNNHTDNIEDEDKKWEERIKQSIQDAQIRQGTTQSKNYYKNLQAKWEKNNDYPGTVNYFVDFLHCSTKININSNHFRHCIYLDELIDLYERYTADIYGMRFYLEDEQYHDILDDWGCKMEAEGEGSTKIIVKGMSRRLSDW